MPSGGKAGFDLPVGLIKAFVMEFFNPQAGIRPRVLATDLDGTLIPLEGDARNVEDLETLAERFERSGWSLVFATGRPLKCCKC